MVRVIAPTGPNQPRRAPCLAVRVAEAADAFAVLTGAAELAVICAAAERPRAPGELAALVGRRQSEAAVTVLKATGLLVGDPNSAYTLSRRGRGVWMAVRSLFR